MYEPYVEVCRRICELHPGSFATKALLQNSGAEAVENAVKIARYATGRDAIVCFDQAFHGRTLLTMTLTSKVMPYKKGFGPFAPEVYRAASPWPYRGIGTDEALASVRKLFKSQVDPQSVAAMIYEPVQGEGGFLPATPGFLEGLQAICREHGIVYIDDEVQSGMGRTGEVLAVDHFDGVEPDLVVWGKSLGGGLPLAGVSGRAELMDASHVGGLGGHVRRQSALVRRGARDARPARRAGLPRGRAVARRAPRTPACARSRRGARRSATCAVSARWSRSSSSRIR